MFVQTDGGRACSKRPRQRNDCTVRAAAMACSVSYDEAYEAIKALGRECSKGAWLPTGKRTARNGVLLGHRWTWHGIPAPERGGKWPTVDRFAATLQGVGVLRVPRHVIAYADGDWFDTSPSYQFGTVRGYWTVKPE